MCHRHWIKDSEVEEQGSGFLSKPKGRTGLGLCQNFSGLLFHSLSDGLIWEHQRWPSCDLRPPFLFNFLKAF